MKCKGFDPESYGFYVLGAASVEETESIRVHIEMGCETCLAEIAAYAGVWNAVGLETPEEGPAPDLRVRVLQEIEQQVTGAAPRRSWLSFWFRPVPALAAAGFAVVALVVGLGVGLRTTMVPTINFSPIVAAPEEAVRAPSALGGPSQAPPVPVPAEPAADDSRRVADEQQIAVLQAELDSERQKSAQLAVQLRNVPPPPAAAPIAAPPTDSGARERQLLDAANAGFSREREDLRARLSVASQRVTTLEREVSQYKTLLELERKRGDSAMMMANMLTGPSLRLIPLKGTEKGPSIQGRVIIAGTSQALFVASNLPALPANRVYQLWLIRSNAPAIASGGVFQPDANREASIRVTDRALLSNITAAAVTDEPVGGSPQPTGSKWMIGL